jgi:hypothetical protein
MTVAGLLIAATGALAFAAGDEGGTTTPSRDAGRITPASASQLSAAAWPQTTTVYYIVDSNEQAQMVHAWGRYEAELFGGTTGYRKTAYVPVTADDPTFLSLPVSATVRVIDLRAGLAP